MGAQFQQHSSGSFTAQPSAPMNGQHPGTTSLKYTLCWQRKQRGTSYLTSHCFVVLCRLKKTSLMKLISSMWLKPDTLGSLTERSPVTHQRATAPPNHIIHPTAPQTSHDSPAWSLQASGALRKKHGPRPTHPQRMGGVQFEHQSENCNIWMK